MCIRDRNVIQKDLDPENAFVQSWKEKFEQEGFQVTVRDRRVSISMEDFVNPAGTVSYTHLQ